MNTISRRSLGKGAAWSVPAIIAAGAVPAMAASPGDVQPEVEVNGRVSWNVDWNSNYVDGNQNFKVYSIIPNTVSPGQGYGVMNTKSSTVIGPMSITFYLPSQYYTMTFHAGVNGTNGWSTLALDYTKSQKIINGVYYYPFTTRYNRNLPAKNGTTMWPAFSFESGSFIGLNADSYYVDHHTTVDGRAVDLNYGPVSLSHG